jgi:hypothetical protein
MTTWDHYTVPRAAADGEAARILGSVIERALGLAAAGLPRDHEEDAALQNSADSQ